MDFLNAFGGDTFNAIYWDPSYNIPLLVNLAIVIGLFTILRFFHGATSNMDASKELLVKDNPAFGISLGGVTFAITILLSGTIYGAPGESLFEAATYVINFGTIGIVLMLLARWIFDKLALPDIHLRDEIVRGNVAVAIAEAGNVLASALIIRAMMIWVTDKSLMGLVSLLGAYAMSQALLTIASWLRLWMFSAVHKGRSTQEELRKGNVAVALSFAGRKIGTAFALTLAANQLAYEAYDLHTILLPWVITSIAAILVLKLITYLAMRIILFRVDTFDEIVNQRNIALGALQGIVYISIAMLVAGLGD